eukprot:SAG31_NODE_5248_length_2651_cov_1.748041_2_plen_162_part_00
MQYSVSRKRQLTIIPQVYLLSRPVTSRRMDSEVFVENSSEVVLAKEPDCSAAKLKGQQDNAERPFMERAADAEGQTDQCHIFARFLRICRIHRRRIKHAGELTRDRIFVWAGQPVAWAWNYFEKLRTRVEEIQNLPVPTGGNEPQAMQTNIARISAISSRR